MINGFVNVLKPVGATASDMVVKLKKIYGQSKIGHLGTLDPGACGVLPIAMGSATKLFDLLTAKTKKYRAFFTFGKTTDTLDAYGKVTQIAPIPQIDVICNALKSFVGDIMQTPPQYSAISVGGVRAYDLARKGVDIQLKQRPVTVHSIELVRANSDTIVVDITCSAGTYIRSLVRDIALSVGTVGYMSGLIRLYSGNFTIQDAFTMDEIEQNKDAVILPIEYPLSSLQTLVVKSQLFDKLNNGVRLKLNKPFDGYKKVVCNQQFFGVGCCVENKLILKYNLKNAN